MSKLRVCVKSRAQSLRSLIPSPHSVETSADRGVHDRRQRIKAESLAELAQSFFEAAARGKEVQPVVKVYGCEAGSGCYSAIEGVAGGGPVPIPARLRDSESAKAGDGVRLQSQCRGQAPIERRALLQRQVRGRTSQAACGSRRFRSRPERMRDRRRLLGGTDREHA